MTMTERLPLAVAAVDPGNLHGGARWLVMFSDWRVIVRSVGVELQRSRFVTDIPYKG
jgi:hypothetical protein